MSVENDRDSREIDMDRGDRVALQHLLRSKRPFLGDGMCPEPEVLAGFIENRLDEENRRIIDSHLANCFACREIAQIASNEEPCPPIVPSPKTNPVGWLGRGRLVAAVFGILTTLAILGYSMWKPSTGVTPTSQTTDAVADLGDLQRKHPLLFKDTPADPRPGLRKLLDRERSSSSLSEESPSFIVLESRPEFSWTGSQARSPGTVTLTHNMEPIWSEVTDQTTLAFPDESPDLVPGEIYGWTLRSKHGTVTSVVFSVANPKERARYEEGRRAIRSIQDPVKRGLLFGAHAAQLGFLSQARQDLLRVLERDPSNDSVSEVLRLLTENLSNPTQEKIRSIRDTNGW